MGGGGFGPFSGGTGFGIGNMDEAGHTTDEIGLIIINNAIGQHHTPEQFDQHGFVLGPEIGINLLGELEQIIGGVYRRCRLGQQRGSLIIIEAEIWAHQMLQQLLFMGINVPVNLRRAHEQGGGGDMQSVGWLRGFRRGRVSGY